MRLEWPSLRRVRGRRAHAVALLALALQAVPGLARGEDLPLEPAALAPATEVVDVPTAVTLYARMFQLNVRMFRGGGVLAKASAAFNNSIQLGVAFKANNVIGSGRVTFDDQPEQVVAAIAKLRIAHLPLPRLLLAAGYDGMGYDLTRKRGLYGAATMDLTAIGLALRAHAGVGATRFRGFKADDDLNVFFGATGSLSEAVQIGAEYDDVLRNDGSFNVMVAYAWDVGLRMELDFKSLFRGVNGYHRVVKILYTF